MKESQTLYLISATVGGAYFDSIIFNYEHNLIEFNQIRRTKEGMGESVVAALQELQIYDYAPRRMSYLFIPYLPEKN
ncbi:hypothetical protein [Sporosarcina aquimarina]|uniref:Uncharacterized protein n=1 Tax=Sporosarcina aquimarina TaxID=114975 RepID=A0ABU4FVD7_9BACL|nr:hypothetical protein [Sporosarcina aquimarina]MDW0108669.1 hypothetical protein [Sporosarcina aquimarina]